MNSSIRHNYNLYQILEIIRDGHRHDEAGAGNHAGPGVMKQPDAISREAINQKIGYVHEWCVLDHYIDRR